MRNALQRLRRSGLDSAALTLVGFALGCGIARVGAKHTPSSQKFAETQEFAIWILVVGFEVALRLVLFAALWRVRTEVRSRVGAGCVRASAGIMLIIAGMFLVTERIYEPVESALWCNDCRRIVLQISMLVTFSPGLVSLYRIGSWVRHAGLRDGLQRPHSPPPGQLVSEVLYVNWTLRRILLMISAIVAVSIVDRGSFRNAFLAQNSSSKEFPAGIVILYGLLLTVILSFIYLPVQSSFNDYKRQLRDALCPIPATGLPDESWYSSRDRIERLLKLPRGTWETLRLNYAILGPLIASVLSPLLRGLGS